MPPSQGLGPQEDAISLRLRGLRGRMAASRAAEDLQRGLAAGALAVLVLGALRYLDVADRTPWEAIGAGTIVALLFPAWGLAFRRTSAHRVALIVDERLGLAERVATALALETRRAPETPLAPLVAEDALLSLRRVAPSSFRRAFLPRFLGRPVALALAAVLLSVAGFRLEPRRAEAAGPKDLAAAYREKKEKEDAQKAARRVKEAAEQAEQAARPKEEALRAVAAEIRRKAQEMMRKNPTKAEAMASFQKMGELVRQRQELLAGMDMEKIQELKDAGKLGQMDPSLEKLLGKLLQAGLPELNSELRSLQDSLRGLEPREWDEASLQSLQDRLEQLASELEANPDGLKDREGLKKALGALGNPELLREIAERIGRLMETLREQGWEACKSSGGDFPGDMDGTGGSEPLTLTDAQLQAMLDRLEELQRMAELGMLTFCQNCGLSGGT